MTRPKCNLCGSKHATHALHVYKLCLVCYGIMEVELEMSFRNKRVIVKRAKQIELKQEGTMFRVGNN